MPVRKLTAAFVKKATAEPGPDRTVYWDQDLPGFGLMVTAGKGHKSYIAQYRAHGTSRRYTIGNAAVIDLDAARKRAKAILGRVAAGGDPVIDERKEAESNRFALRSICENYLKREGAKIRTADRRRAMLERLVYPKLAARPIDSINRSDINHLLDYVEDHHGSATADNVLALLRRIMNWHAVRSAEYRTPIVAGMRRSESKERERVLSDDELRAGWTTAEQYPGAWGQFIRFLLLTGARRDEAAEMRWAEISGDLWVIPASRYKTKTEVTLPLSSAAKKVLAEVPRFPGGEFVFTTTGRRPI